MVSTKLVKLFSTKLVCSTKLAFLLNMTNLLNWSTKIAHIQTLTLSHLDFSKVIENRVALKSSTETDRKSLVTEFKINGNFMAGRDVLEEFYARI